METQKIVNLSIATDNESSKFATKKWYVVNDQNNIEYEEENENDSSIKFETKVIQSSLCVYSDAYILVKGKKELQVVMRILKLYKYNVCNSYK